jgi:hypothetical protein
MWNKSKNPSKEMIDFLLQDLWNTFFLKCVDANHTFIAKNFKEKMNGLMKKKEERQLTHSQVPCWT